MRLPVCLRCETVLADFAARVADLMPGKTRIARTAITAITTNNSMRVNAVWVTRWGALRACARRWDDPGRAPAEDSARQASKPMQNNLAGRRGWDVFMLFVIFDQ